MATEKKERIMRSYNHGGGAVYGLGLIGALFYFLQSATTFQQVIWGIIQSILWPAFIVYQLFTFLQS